MNLLELFCGSKSISKVAESMGIQTFTVDINKRFKPDYLVDIFDFDIAKIPFHPDIVWCSPPCQCFSIATVYKHWKDKKPVSPDVFKAIALVEITVNIIELLQPNYWFIENPRGMMRYVDILKPYKRYTVTYCQYGDVRMKPTDIWSNNLSWNPKQMCRPADLCHITNYTQEFMTTPAKRAVIPGSLCRDILELCINTQVPLKTTIQF